MTNFGAAVSNSPYGSIQLGYDFSQSPPNGSITYATTSVTTTLTISLHAGYSISDPSYTLSISGDWAYSGAPVAVSIPSGGGTQVLWSGTVTRSLTPGSGSSQSFSASISGLYQYNATATVSGTNYTDVRPYGTGTPTLSNASPVMGNPTMPIPVTITANRTSTTHGVRFWVSYGAFTSYIGASVGGIQWPGAGPDTMTYDFPVASLGSQIPNTTSGGGAIYCDYFDAGSAFIGTAGVAFSASIPSTVVPTLTSVTNTETGTTGVTLTGKYVQNYSAATFAITGATPQGGAGSIVSGVITVNGTPYAVAMPGLTTTLNPLPTAGTGLVVSGTVTDSRGRVSAVTAGPTIDVLAYSPPVISTFNPPSRWTGSPGAADDLGTSIQVVSAGSASVLPSSLSPAQRNSLIWKVETQPISGGSWTTQKTTTIPQGTTPTLAWSSTDLLGTVLGGGFTLAATQAYNVRLSAQDAFYTTTATLLLPVGTVTMSWSQTGVGIGKIAVPGRTLDVGGDAYVSGSIYQGSIPVLGSLPLSVDLDTVTVTGHYSQSSNASATVGNHYPIAYAGLLEVEAYASGTYVNQRYTTYKFDGWVGSRTFVRSWSGGSWGVWREYVLADANVWTLCPTQPSWPGYFAQYGSNRVPKLWQKGTLRRLHAGTFQNNTTWAANTAYSGAWGPAAGDRPVDVVECGLVVRFNATMQTVGFFQWDTAGNMTWVLGIGGTPGSSAIDVPDVTWSTV